MIKIFFIRRGGLNSCEALYLIGCHVCILDNFSTG